MTGPGRSGGGPGDSLSADLLKTRQEASTALAARQADFDLADLSEEQFERELDRMKTRLSRIDRICKTRLIDGVHYGIPKMKDGKPVPGIKNPFLFQPGAEELRQIYRLTTRHAEGSPRIDASDKFVDVTVTLGVYDSMGRLIGQRSANCNTREKRFQKSSGGWIYTDAREQTHNCIAMAEKRAGVFLTREATGASAYFANPDELEKALDAEVVEVTTPPWTEEEKTKVYRAAKEAGIKTKEDFEAFKLDVLGEDPIGTGLHVEQLMQAIARKKEGQRAPLSGSGDKDPFAPAETDQ